MEDLKKCVLAAVRNGKSNKHFMRKISKRQILGVKPTIIIYKNVTICYFFLSSGLSFHVHGYDLSQLL